MHNFPAVRRDIEQAAKLDPLIDAQTLYRHLSEQLSDARTLSEAAAIIRFGSVKEWHNELMRMGVECGRALSVVGQMEAELPGALRIELLGSRYTKGWNGE